MGFVDLGVEAKGGMINRAKQYHNAERARFRSIRAGTPQGQEGLLTGHCVENHTVHMIR